ncbi:MAG: SCP2 sterol-binding domain-containing protein [Candidatus Heimdallarchaeota archaeon]|nr:SCP2 sterol-binding domain-containing protein [Candidatus Heimdallarchaeota archaeon]MCK4954680.1 SCP2 sterol-binding domain-containing protein [Candidatus Heimdallarchaeota archaeon]
MKAKFPSKEWIEQFMVVLNNSPDYKEAAEWWEGDFLFVVETDEKLDKKATFYLDLWHGDCRSVDYFEEGQEPPETEFQYIGKYSNWLKVINGDLDPIKGILTRKFKLVGDKGKVMRATKAAKELVNSAQKVPTEFV